MPSVLVGEDEDTDTTEGKPHEDLARRRHVQGKERGLRRDQLHQHFDLGLPAFRIVRK